MAAMMEGSAHEIPLHVNGVAITMPAGATVAAALVAAASPSRIALGGEPRGPLCGMGICMECRATVDGIAHVRTCQVQVRSGMKVMTA